MIGVFDSGSGGLTILKELARSAPRRSFLYLGDHAGAPYGERSREDVMARTRVAVDYLFSSGCRLVILACNTAAAVSLRPLQQGWLKEEHPEKRVLGVLVPVVEAITGRDWNGPLLAGAPSPAGEVLVFATRRTVESAAFPTEIAKRAPSLHVTQIACPSLVGLIESGAPDDRLRDAVFGYVGDALGLLGGAIPDSAILGCTHYPLAARHFAAALPKETRILSQPELAAARLLDYLERHPDIDEEEETQRLAFLTSGDAERAGRLASAFWEKHIRFEPLARSLAPILVP